MKRKVALITSARSDYSTMYPVMQAAQLDPEIDASIFCAGMHLVEEFGYTYRQLEADGLEISEKVDYHVPGDGEIGLVQSLAKGVLLFSEALVRQNPDIILVSGDRIENMALFTAATALKIPICHMCGGDITEGAFDNQVRHMMTKLAHLHMVSMPEHARRVLQMGEEPWRITLTGDAALDTVVGFTPLNRKDLFSLESIPEQGYLALSTFHPQTLGEVDSLKEYANLLTALAEVDAIPVLTYPNIDPGFEPLIEMLEGFQRVRPDAVIKRSFTREGYYSMMAHAGFMIGNSSSGLWEAPSFELPCVNVGARQAGRLRAANVIDVDGLDLDGVRAAIKTAQSTAFRSSLKNLENPYGKGRAAALTLDVIKSASLGDRLLMKKFYECDAGLADVTIRGMEPE